MELSASIFCAREIRGEWTDEADRPYTFTLRKQAPSRP